MQQTNHCPSTPVLQFYTPRIESNDVQRTVSRPTTVRLERSCDNEACELGMVQHGEEAHSQPRFGLGGTLSGLYDRMVGTQHIEHVAGKATSRESGRQKQAYTTSPQQISHDNRQQSLAFILGRCDEPMEPDDPRITGMARKSADLRRPSAPRTSTSNDWNDDEKGGIKARTRAMSLANIMDPIRNAVIANGGMNGGQKKEQRYHSSVEAHIDLRRRFVLKMARALMLFGAPSHRVESQLNALASVLGVDAQFIHFPGIVIVSFGDWEANTSQCHFVKSKTEIALGRLTELHTVYKAVLADDITVAEAAVKLDALLKAKPEWSNLSRILFSIVKCGMMAPINFGGSFVDIWISAAFGGLLTFSQLCLAGNNQMFSNVFDIAIAIIFSFLSRLLSTKSVFCYEAIASSGLIGLLPGYAVCEWGTNVCSNEC